MSERDGARRLSVSFGRTSRRGSFNPPPANASAVSPTTAATSAAQQANISGLLLPLPAADLSTMPSGHFPATIPHASEDIDGLTGIGGSANRGSRAAVTRTTVVKDPAPVGDIDVDAYLEVGAHLERAQPVLQRGFDVDDLLSCGSGSGTSLEVDLPASPPARASVAAPPPKHGRRRSSSFMAAPNDWTWFPRNHKPDEEKLDAKRMVTTAGSQDIDQVMSLETLEGRPGQLRPNERKASFVDPRLTGWTSETNVGGPLSTGSSKRPVDVDRLVAIASETERQPPKLERTREFLSATAINIRRKSHRPQLDRKSKSLGNLTFGMDGADVDAAADEDRQQEVAYYPWTREGEDAEDVAKLIGIGEKGVDGVRERIAKESARQFPDIDQMVVFGEEAMRKLPEDARASLMSLHPVDDPEPEPVMDGSPPPLVKAASHGLVSKEDIHRSQRVADSADLTPRRQPGGLFRSPSTRKRPVNHSTPMLSSSGPHHHTSHHVKAASHSTHALPSEGDRRQRFGGMLRAESAAAVAPGTAPPVAKQKTTFDIDGLLHIGTLATESVMRITEVEDAGSKVDVSQIIDIGQSSDQVFVDRADVGLAPSAIPPPPPPPPVMTDDMRASTGSIQPTPTAMKAGAVDVDGITSESGSTGTSPAPRGSHAILISPAADGGRRRKQWRSASALVGAGSRAEGDARSSVDELWLRKRRLLGAKSISLGQLQTRAVEVVAVPVIDIDSLVSLPNAHT
ncbi:hypothetical protein HK101_011894 [Irineochytrium annulatum]|nr:hypothetical protein HK101_011894 [Irineochytrium annulatum]